MIKNLSKETFFTSDQPVINLKSKDDGSVPDEFVLYYPLSPKIAIQINDNNSNNEIVIKDENVVHKYNDKLIKEANEYVVSCNKEQLGLL